MLIKTVFKRIKLMRLKSLASWSLKIIIWAQIITKINFSFQEELRHITAFFDG